MLQRLAPISGFWLIVGIAVLAAPPWARARDAALLVAARNNAQEGAISDGQRARLIAEIARVPASLRARFDERYSSWKSTWQRPDILISSNSKAVRKSEEFRSLVSLGPPILPLVVGKLLEPDEFFALQLYDTLQNRPALRDEHFDQGEQRRALATARRWLSR
jgi:hypothetical protein